MQNADAVLYKLGPALIREMKKRKNGEKAKNRNYGGKTAKS